MKTATRFAICASPRWRTATRRTDANCAKCRAPNPTISGEYRIFDLPAGRYFLKINPPQLQMFGNEPTPRDSYATVYYPGVAQVTGRDPAGPHAGTAAARAFLQFAQGPLRHHPRQSDRACRCDQCERRTADRHRGRIEQHFRAMWTTKTGKFEFRNVPPGSILPDRRLHAQQPAVRHDDPDRGRRGRCRWDRTAPGAARRHHGPDFGGGRPGVRRFEDRRCAWKARARDTTPRPAPPSARTVSCSSRASRRAGIASRWRRLQALYIKSIRWGTTDITDAQLDLLAGIPPRTELAIALGADGGQIDGVVVTTKNRSPATRRPSRWCRRARTSPRRSISARSPTPPASSRIRGIAPGSYKLYAWDKVDANAVMYDPEFPAAVRGRGAAHRDCAGRQEDRGIEADRQPRTVAQPADSRRLLPDR